jgi:hypothetical protein
LTGRCRAIRAATREASRSAPKCERPPRPAACAETAPQVARQTPHPPTAAFLQNRIQEVDVVIAGLKRADKTSLAVQQQARARLQKLNLTIERSK